MVSCSAKKNLIYKNYLKDIKSFNILIDQFVNNVENIWGINEILIVHPKDYVKYTHRYYVRSHINFKKGKITVESISNNNLIKNIRQEIINVLLISKIPSYDKNVYFEHSNIIIGNNIPLLYTQILDNKGKFIKFKNEAMKFANYLISNKLQVRFSQKNNLIWSINIPIVSYNLDKKAHKYLNIIRKASKKYKVNAALILAIIKIESSFNSDAISNSEALGLMQIIQNTAGVDVFKYQGKIGMPSKKYLLNPIKNIDTGTAYLAMLQENYLSNINHPISKLYAVISAYNSGAGNVLKIFSNDKDSAFKKINSITPKTFYNILLHEHPSEEARRYLFKVSHLQKLYKTYFE